ncbi:hypothetical protein EBQ90_00940 [bacterium]|nr:hypothetical protein [bacterium]
MRKLVLATCFGVLIWFRMTPGEKQVSIPRIAARPAQCSTPTAEGNRAIASEEPRVQALGYPDLNEEKLRQQWGVQDYHQMEAEESESPFGKTVSYRFVQEGVPILGMVVRMTQNTSGEFVEEENTYRPIPRVDLDIQDLAERAEIIKTDMDRYQMSDLNTESLVILVRESVSEGELAFSTQAIDSVLNSKPTQLLLRVEDGQLLQKGFLRAEFGH